MQIADKTGPRSYTQHFIKVSVLCSLVQSNYPFLFPNFAVLLWPV